MDRKQAFGADFREQQRRSAHSHGEKKKSTQSKGKCQRRAAAKDVFRFRHEDVFRKRVTDGQKVAMEMHGRFRLAGCSRTESDQCDIILRQLQHSRIGRNSHPEMAEASAPVELS